MGISEGTKAVSFADGFPFLLASQTSINDVKYRVDEGKAIANTNISIDIRRFRPNIVVESNDDTLLPFQEDYWSEFTINDNVFYIVKPCSRCSVPMVDPDQGKLTKKNGANTYNERVSYR